MKKIEYIKEEIATYREIVKLIVIIIVALIGSMVSFAIKFLETKYYYYYLIFSLLSFIVSILFFTVLIKVWNRMYEFKFKLKDKNV